MASAWGKTANLDIIVEEVDVLHGAAHDLLNEDVWKKLREIIKADEFQAIVISPPCSTYSRSRLDKKGGPPRCGLASTPGASLG